jgi:hypothetical protein
MVRSHRRGSASLDLAGLSKIVLFLAVVVATIPALRRQWRNDRAGFIQSVKAFAAFLLYCAIGIAILLALVPEPQPPGARREVLIFALIAFLLGWIFLGALWLARLAPRYQDVPAWVDHRFGPVDLALIATIAVSLLVRALA